MGNLNIVSCRRVSNLDSFPVEFIGPLLARAGSLVHIQMIG